MRTNEGRTFQSPKGDLQGPEAGARQPPLRNGKEASVHGEEVKVQGDGFTVRALVTYYTEFVFGRNRSPEGFKQKIDWIWLTF